MSHTISLGEMVETTDLDLGSSEWFQIDQGRVDDFARVTNDFQFIHVDQAEAEKTPFGGTIAHGFLVLSLLTPLCSDLMLKLDGALMTLNYGFDKIRFLAPVRVGARVRVNATLIGAEEKKPGQVLSRYEISVEIENEEKAALVAEWLALMIVG